MDSIVIMFWVIIGLFWWFWAETLRTQAGEDERVWFYLTLLIPPLSILYRLVKLR